MIMTPQHERKVQQVQKLLRMSAQRLRQDETWIDYLYVRWGPSVLYPEQYQRAMIEYAHDLRGELLAANGAFPDGYELIKEVQVVRSDGRELPYLRLFRINRIQPAETQSR